MSDGSKNEFCRYWLIASAPIPTRKKFVLLCFTILVVSASALHNIDNNDVQLNIKSRFKQYRNYKVDEIMNVERTTTRNIFSGIEDDDDRHNKDPEDENQDNPPSPPEFTFMPSNAPTFIPTNHPTKSPTSSPSKSPTKSPVVSPVASSPTSSPISSPSKSPVASPTSSPIASPTKSPLASPVSSPTKSPIVSSPTSSPTTLSSSPSIKNPTPSSPTSPTNSPIIDELSCRTVTNQNDYGTTTSTNANFLNFVYEMYMDESASSDTIMLEDEVVPSIEKSISCMLSQGIIADNSKRDVRRTRRFKFYKESRNRYLESGIVGVSSQPKDTIDPQPCASTTSIAGATCILVNGILSFYMDGDDVDTTASSVVSNIDTSMKQDELLYSHPSLKKIKMMTYSIGYVTDDDNYLTNDDIDDRNVIFTPGYLAGIAIAGSMMLCCILMARLYVVKPTADSDSDSEIDKAHWREISFSPTPSVSDEQTIHVSNRELGTNNENGGGSSKSLRRSENGGGSSKSLRRSISDKNVQIEDLHDTIRVNVDLESFEPRSREEKDGCFDFFDLILEGTGIGSNKRQSIVDADDERSHISEISF